MLINDLQFTVPVCNMCVPRDSQVSILSKTFINKTRVLSAAKILFGMIPKAEVQSTVCL